MGVAWRLEPGLQDCVYRYSEHSEYIHNCCVRLRCFLLAARHYSTLVVCVSLSWTVILESPNSFSGKYCVQRLRSLFVPNEGQLPFCRAAFFKHLRGTPLSS